MTLEPVARTGDKNDESNETILFFVEFSYENNVSMVLDGASLALELNSHQSPKVPNDTRAGAPMADTGDGNEESHETMLFLVEFSYVNIVSMVLDNASVALELNSA